MEPIAVHDPLSQSADLTAENIERLRELFPQAVTEDAGPSGAVSRRIDFEVLRELLGDELATGEEKYGLNWHGKRAARRLALTPSTGTLRPAPEESVDWDTTQNLMIEGDNLEVLKLLQKSYAGKVKMIYIDPPYNTGKDFVYKDNFRDNIGNYQRITGQRDSGGITLTTNADSSGRFHTDWLNMMYPRLMLARTLLREDGVMFVSCDEHEIVNLRAACGEIFGAENDLNAFIWKRKAGGGDDSEHFAAEHEYILLFARDASKVMLGNIEHESAAMTAKYNRTDGKRRFYLERLDKTSLTYSESMDYAIDAPDGTKIKPPQQDPSHPSTIWRWSKDKVKGQRAELHFDRDKKTGEWRVYTRTWESLDGVTPRSLLVDKKFGRNRDGTLELSELIGPKVFTNPKPVKLLSHLIAIGAFEEDAIILDFFAGSGSLGDATMRQNALDNGGRRFILTQLPVATERTDFKTIAQITEERLRKAATKIKTESSLFHGDLGFRVFKLDTTSIRPWDPTLPINEQRLLGEVDNILPGRTEQDLLYELLLKRGLELTAPIVERTFAGRQAFAVSTGDLIACLAPRIETADVEPLAHGIVEWHKELAPPPASDPTAPLEKPAKVQPPLIVFRDTAFVDDVAKSNLTEILKQHGLTDVRSL